MFKSDLLPLSFEVLPKFSPVISDQYLFIFDKLEEDNICLIYNLPFGQAHRYVFNEPSDRETRSCLKTSLSLSSIFNEPSDKDNSVLFIFRESEKGT